MSLSAPFIAWLGTPARRCLIAEVGVKSGGTEITRYLSSTPFKTEPADTPANQPYMARIAGGVQFTRRLDLDGSGGSQAFGDIELDNTDGALDAWLGDVWAGRPINLYLGQEDWPKSSFEKVFSGTVDDIQPRARNRMNLALADIFGPLNTAISTATVGGTADNKNALLPIALGECFNVLAVLVDAATPKYAVHLAAAIERVIEVRDNALAVAATASVSTGSFTKTTARFGTITADVQGAKLPDPGSPLVIEWRNDAGGLIEWVATELGDGQFITSGQIDQTRLSAFRAACPQPLGLYINAQRPRLDVMRELAASVGATLTTTYDGKLILARVGFGAPVGAIGPRQMMEDSGPLKPLSRPLARGAIRLDGCRNWTPQTADIAGSVTLPQYPIFQDEYTPFAATDATVLADWKQSATPAARPTLMVVDADVSAEAARLLALWKVPRTVFGFTGWAELLQYEIGDTVTLTHPRFGLAAGVPAQIVGVQHDWVRQRVSLEVLV